MTAQEAASQLLREVGKPQPSKVLAERMLKRGLVRSNALDPIQSFAQTIEKNIRDGVYNRPALKFVHTPHGRMIDLAGATTSRSTKTESSVSSEATPLAFRVIGPDDRTFLEVSSRLVNKLGLVTFAGLASTHEEAADLVLARGFDAMKDDIASGMRVALSTRPAGAASESSHKG